jgi:undecaprenyl-diphosphatase
MFGDMTRRLLPFFAIACLLAAPLGAQEAAQGSGPTMSAGGGKLLPLDSSPGKHSMMTIGQGALLGLVEGLTEFLPVSSTGHLVVVQGLLGLTTTPQDKAASDAFAIVIQAGAIIAVILALFGRVRKVVAGIFGRDRDGLKLFANLVVAVIPAAIIGVLLESRIQRYLYGAWPIVAAWIVGGIFILVVLNRGRLKEGTALETLGWQSALIIGIAQVLALWPGVSRSLVTIAGGLMVGLSMSAAVEFSFLLGLLTLGGATIYEGLKRGHDIVSTFGWASPAAGLVVAAVAAFVAVRWMMDYLRTRSLAVFGWYRIGAAAVVVILVAAGALAV